MLLALYPSWTISLTSAALARRMAYSNPYQPPKQGRTVTTAGADIDATLTLDGVAHAPQFAVVGAATSGDSLVLEWEKLTQGDDTQSVFEGKYIGGGFSKIDSTSTSGIELTLYY